MKRSLKLFNKKGKKPRRRENQVDYDRDYDRDDYDEEYDEEDYPDDEFEEEYGDYQDEDDYSDEDYDGRDRRRYRDEEDYPEDRDDRRRDEEKYPEDRDDRRRDERYESDEDYREDDYDDYGDEVAEDQDYAEEPDNVVVGKFGADRVEDERDYRDEEVDEEEYPEDDYEREGEYEEEYDPEQEGEYEDDYDPEADEDYDREDYRDEEDYPEEDEDYDPEYDEDYDPEYDEDYVPEYDEEDEDYDRGGRGDRRGRGRRDGDGESVGAKILNFIKETSVAERAAAIVAVLLVVGGIFTMSFYSKALGRTEEIQSFVEVGTNLQVSDVVGSSGLLAIADAQRAKAMTAEMLGEDEEEEPEVADDAKGVVIKMTVTSIKSDMKVKFINSETNKLVANVPFNIEVVTPDGTKVTYDDHDKDGIIYKKDITAGTYKITPLALPSEYSNYNLDTSTKSLTVKDTVEMKAVDVSNEIKKESQVNAAVEDTAVQTVVESELKDTVDWVDSNQGVSSGDGKYSYEAVDKKNNVADPSSTSKLELGSIRRTARSRARANDTTEGQLTEPGNTGEGEKTEGGETGNGETGTEGENSGNNGGSTEGGNTETPADQTMSLANSSLSLKVGETGSVKASGPSSPSYSSSNDSVASVSSDGTVTAKGEGSATITVKADGYKDATASITVTAAPVENKNMTLAATTLSLKIGETGSVKASGPSSATYSSSNDGVASVSGDGTVTAKAEGTATITVKADGYNDATATVTVTKPENGTITLAAKTLMIPIGQTGKILATGPSAVTFKSSDESIATVGTDGVVKAIKEGTVTITVSADKYNDATVSVTVTKSGTGEFKLNVSKVTMVQGKTYQIAPTDSNLKPTYTSGNTGVATIASDGTITAVAEGETTITAKCDGYSDLSVSVKVLPKSTVLKDKSGNTLYVKDGDSYREATYADYYSDATLYLRKENSNSGTRYGWWTIDGKTYYYDKNGNAVTGEQVIKGAKYSFNSDGSLSSSSGTLGIDVSKWNGNIDWGQVKKSGVNFVIIRCGYRGSSAGALIEDPKFKANIKGAQNAGLKVGVYFFTQAINEVEAVEEASMVISLIKGYSLSFPVYLDVEGSNGRGDTISASQRTANIKAFCGTIQSAGYQAGVYANKTWFTSHINTSQISNYKIWLAQYAAAVSYTGSRYDMWQYTSKGSVSGISGKVDMNILYR